MNKRQKKAIVKSSQETLSDHIHYATGRLIVSIGTGDFLDMANFYLMDMHARGFQAGQRAKLNKAK